MKPDSIRLSKSTLARNPGLRGKVTAIPDPEEAPPKRSRGPKLKKSEAEWLAILKERYPAPRYHVQAHMITVRFPDNDRYTPDIVLTHGPASIISHGREIVATYEVKAGYRGPGWEQGMERYKRAREAFPWLRLRMATKTKGKWEVTE